MTSRDLLIGPRENDIGEPIDRDCISDSSPVRFGRRVVNGDVRQFVLALTRGDLSSGERSTEEKRQRDRITPFPADQLSGFSPIDESEIG